MIGEMLARVRNDKNIAKAELSRRTNINIGHLSHIERGERNPSHRALKAICRALQVPYQPLMYTYDKVFTEEQKLIKMTEHISYNQVLAVDSLNSFMACPADLPNASISVKIDDDSMSPKLEKGVYVFVEFNTPLENKDIGLFEYNDKILIRRFVVRKDSLVLRADNKTYGDIIITDQDKYNIIGKIIGTNTGIIF